MLEIGTRFEALDEEYVSGFVTIMGYVYYDGRCYYTCVDEDGNEADIYYLTAQDALDD